MLRRTLDAAVRSSGTFDSFLDFMQAAGYEIKRGKYISFRATGQERFTRAKTVGEGYTEERIRERLAEDKTMVMLPKWINPTTGKILDHSDAKIQSNPAYRHWASLHNLHAMADTHNYLAEHHNLDLADFEQRYADCVARRAAAQAECDKACQKIAVANNSVLDTLKQINEHKSRTAKEISALNIEIVEMERIRANAHAMFGEKLYNKHSRGGAEL